MNFTIYPEINVFYLNYAANMIILYINEPERSLDMDSYTFFPLAFRMKYINRWGLMRNVTSENLLDHSAECSMLAHSLAVIGNTYFGKSYDEGRIAVMALYHDISEIYTGDLPTPVKYHSSDISSSYKEIEHGALQKLLLKLPEELRSSYESLLEHDVSTDEGRIVKAADKLCALIKCMDETKNGNAEFREALSSTKRSVEKLAESCEELGYFIKNILPEFEKSLDEM